MTAWVEKKDWSALALTSSPSNSSNQSQSPEKNENRRMLDKPGPSGQYRKTNIPIRNGPPGILRAGGRGSMMSQRAPGHYVPPPGRSRRFGSSWTSKTEDLKPSDQFRGVPSGRVLNNLPGPPVQYRSFKSGLYGAGGGVTMTSSSRFSGPPGFESPPVPVQFTVGGSWGPGIDKPESPGRFHRVVTTPERAYRGMAMNSPGSFVNDRSMSPVSVGVHGRGSGCAMNTNQNYGRHQNLSWRESETYTRSRVMVMGRQGRPPPGLVHPRQASGRNRYPQNWRRRLTFQIGPLYHEKTLECELGWLKTYPGDSSGYLSSAHEDLTLTQFPLRNGQPTSAQKRISIKVNHLKATITLPKMLYHYEVDMRWEHATATRKTQDIKKFMRFDLFNVLINGVNKEGMKCKDFEGLKDMYYRKSGGKTVGVVTDYSTALYTTQSLGSMMMMNIHIRVSEEAVFPERIGSNRYIQITLIDTGENIKTESLQKFVDENRDVILDPHPEFKKIETIYNAVLKNLMTERYTPVGRSSLILFEGDGSPLGKGIVNYGGYSTIFPIFDGRRPYLHIDNANVATVMGGNILDVMTGICGKRTDAKKVDFKKQDNSFGKASAVLRGCRVQYKPSPGGTCMDGWVEYLSGIESISKKVLKKNKDPERPMRLKLMLENFQNEYGSSEMFDCENDPVVKLGSNKLVPAKLCDVPKGQNYKGMLNVRQAFEMMNDVDVSPSILEKHLQNAKVELHFQNNPVLKDFGITLEQNFLELTGTRVLPPPQLCFGKECGAADGSPRVVVDPIDGSWEVCGVCEVQKPCRVKAWGILNLCGATTSELGRFADILTEEARKIGMEIAMAEPPIMEVASDDPSKRNRNMEVIRKHLIALKYCEFVLVVIARKSAVKEQVKQVADLEIGIVTQCVLHKNIRHPKDVKVHSMAGTMSLQLNSKLKGLNYTIQPIPQMEKSFRVMRYPVLIIGADVTLPQPGLNGWSWERKQVPCFVGVTGNTDRSGIPFMTYLQAQERVSTGTAEYIQGLDFIVRRFIETFEKTTGTRPRKIIYYRDGVGRGDFKKILQVELNGIRKACRDLERRYEPQITFIAMEKRHKTRFFHERDGKIVNAPPGTVVDTEIVHPTQNDFYLLSHKSRIGTSRPVRYNVLWDDSRFSTDEIQTLTYYLCYMYVLCCNSIKIPAPTYYAHRAAARAKCLAQGQKFEGTHAEQIMAINKLLDKRLAFEQKMLNE